MNHRNFLLTALPAILLTACSDDPPAPRTAIAATGAPVAGMAHGNHDPKFNGVVMMTGNLHLEIVANHDGYYKVYFSDEARQELPAAAVSELKLSVTRPGIRGEPIQMKVDNTGEHWEGKGGSVRESESTLLVSFTFQGERRSTDLPFAAAAGELKMPGRH